MAIMKPVIPFSLPFVNPSLGLSQIGQYDVPFQTVCTIDQIYMNSARASANLSNAFKAGTLFSPVNTLFKSKDEALEQLAGKLLASGVVSKKQDQNYQPIELVMELSDVGYRDESVTADEPVMYAASADIDSLVANLQSPTRETRIEAIKALGESDDLRAIVPLVEGLIDQNADLSDLVTAALNKIGSSRVRKYLLDQVKDEPNIGKQNYAKRALFRLGALRLGILGHSICEGEDQAARIESAFLFGAICSPHLIHFLTIISECSNEEFRIEAKIRLAKFGAIAIESILESLESEDQFLRNSAEMTLSQIEAEVERTMIPSDRSSEQFHEILEKFSGSISDPDFLAHLMWVLVDPDKYPVEWRYAVSVYGIIGKMVNDLLSLGVCAAVLEEDGETFESLVKDIDIHTLENFVHAFGIQAQDVRHGAIMAISGLTDLTFVEFLLNTLNHTDEGIRMAAAHILVNIGLDAVRLQVNPLIISEQTE